MGILWEIGGEEASEIAKRASDLAMEYARLGISYLEATDMLVEAMRNGKTLEDARNEVEKKIIEGGRR